MINGYQIIDADAHVFEPQDLWQNYLEPGLKQFALTPPPDITIQGEKIYRKISNDVHNYAVKNIGRNHPTLGIPNGFDSESQVRAMMQMGVDISFLYPSLGLWVMGIDSMTPQLAGAFTRAYNNWLHDFCSYNPQILKGVGAINLHDPEEMIPELHRVVAFGWNAVFLRSNPVQGRLLSDPTYEPFWTECEALGVAVGIHESGSHSRLPTTGADRFNTRFGMHACSHPMEQMMALLALIEGGVLERHPNLRVGFLESGCGWLLYWLWRLDEEYEELGWEVKNNVTMKPSEYFRRQCFITIEPSEPYLDRVIQDIGVDNLLFGSDYPHMDHKQDIVTRAVALQEQLGEETVRKILWHNPVRFYGL
ncbi:MAG: amidohydrolase family protein [Coleofasciculus sp. B1-GNL1-01]|uniref:amidohydrolase family protein n=1 Tax=Coleofasciculus sp. B1-GNL1-01 TaxID=3068484 RepID=UPI0032F563DF